MVQKTIAASFKQKADPAKQGNWKLYGLTPEQFEVSTMNPLTKMRLDQCHHSHDDGHDHHISCWEYIKNLFHEDDDDESEEEGHHHHDIKWYQSFVICPETRSYIVLDGLVTFFSLISGYYYGTIAGFRYSELDAMDSRNFNIHIVFESIFFIHMFMQFFLMFDEEDG